MKVDLVVSSMIQQIDRSLQSQMTPALMWRAGEILRGRVMLATGNELQIRLDSGALLNALPAGDVFLFPGSTVTLRVAGRMDGRFVMRLLQQEPPAERPQSGKSDSLPAAARTLPDSTPQHGAVAAAIARMRLPANETTVREALAILGRFPGLDAERAVFMAANGIAATPESVEALNRLLAGRAPLGADLTELAELLTDGAVQPAADAGLRLESLAVAALGAEAAEATSGVASRIDMAGLAGQAVTLVLDGLNAENSGEFAGRVKALAGILPDAAAPEAEAFLRDVATGLARAETAGRFDAQTVARQARGPESLPRIVAQIGRLFAHIDAENPAEELANAVSSQKPVVERIAGELRGSGHASPEALQRMRGIENQVRLIDGISRYAYRQIPVELQGRRATAELYVLDRGRGGRGARPGSANILVALETEYLGRVEALVQVSRKSLRMRFGVEKAEIAGFVEARAAELGCAMQAIGYRLSGVGVQMIRRPVTPLTVEEQAGPEPYPAALDVRL